MPELIYASFARRVNYLLNQQALLIHTSQVDSKFGVRNRNSYVTARAMPGE
ncbi:MAG TPA: hypothetical protein VGC61_02140 [Pyrinomonadaceae bacterium]